jgi:hypothetical protein
MAAMTSRRVARLAVMVALAALASTGCGGSAKTNGLEKKSAAQVQQDAVAALRDPRGIVRTVGCVQAAAGRTV